MGLLGMAPVGDANSASSANDDDVVSKQHDIVNNTAPFYASPRSWRTPSCAVFTDIQQLTRFVSWGRTIQWSAMAKPTTSFLMRNPDELSLVERRALRGQWVALERYTPQNLALRRIAALADSPAQCRRQLQDAGHDPALYEFVLLR